MKSKTTQSQSENLRAQIRRLDGRILNVWNEIQQLRRRLAVAKQLATRNPQPATGSAAH